MTLILDIIHWLGIGFFFACVVVCVGVWLFLRRLKATLRLAAGRVQTPARISLVRELEPRWRTPRAIEQFSEGLKAQGFIEVGCFKIPEFKNLGFRAFVHPGERLYATVYDHVMIAPTFDVFCNFEDGRNLTGVNTAMGSALDQCPWKTTLWMPGKSVAQVFEAVRGRQHASPRLPVSAEAYIDCFLSAYKKTMDWRIQKGGISRDEIRRQAAARGKPVTEATIQRAYNALRGSHASQLREACLEEYRAANHLAQDRWEEVKARGILVLETYTRDQVIAAIAERVELSAEERAALEALQLEGGTAVDLVERAISGPLAWKRVTKLGWVESPARACLLLAPEEARVGA